MHNSRKRKSKENKTAQASTSTDNTPTPIIIEPIYACDICDKLCYMNDVKQIKEKHVSVLVPEFQEMDVVQFKACVTCTEIINRDHLPSLSSSNGFTYPLHPTHLPPLDCISERLVAPRLQLCESED
jgi:hypothetical protein